ncbi:MAG TPA: hypothetical protein DCZ94_04580 [Lentisphaeria bacterium]|nr:MAG: hypothetical protein A2X48_20190 [Lentisphaerae bacterium GWF2_49_21]HBC86211.1 hypothetical protein [Lentisphaeria bacterium]
MTINIILLILLTVASLWAVVKGSLVKSAIALAAASVILSILMFRLASPLAAVFELSVCAGLITVIFMSVISLTKPMTHFEENVMHSSRIRRFWLLPVILIVAAIILVKLDVSWDKMIRKAPSASRISSAQAIQNAPLDEEQVMLIEDRQRDAKDVKHVMWNTRRLDILGQVLILLAGVFAVVVLFKYKPDRLSNPEGEGEEKNG